MAEYWTQKKAAELNKAIGGHSRTPCVQHWNEICNAPDGQMHCGRTWHLLRHLLVKTNPSPINVIDYPRPCTAPYGNTLTMI
ncbi:hypothetical protein HPB48_026853 [Haemaphysalis longicornis]|uniref:Uncharacterized protein n=1 Tax=Haemaphysalis longicornis TaxID=44386 RepID=A0A9J6H263_HAELO|nr:hypothetical protein HPB48_026853 [Haemaphysalis longicornis]